MDTLRIRIYNVLFGDAILLTIPEDGGPPLKVLFDFGNALVKGGNDDALLAVAKDLKQELAGEPLDLYVMTHEHMDHVQGPLLVRDDFALKARHIWMTASSAEDYYQRFTEAREKHLRTLAAYHSIAAFLATPAAGAVPEEVRTLVAINNPRASKDCVKFISEMGVGTDGAGTAPLYVHRTADVSTSTPFRETKLRLLAPEEDTSVYYGRLPPRTLGALFDGTAPVSLDPKTITPPAGVSAGDFFDLIEFRSNGMSANLRTIDKAANNSSVVIELEWRGWRLLFPGDAEEKSWEIMDRNGLLRPVHFLKVSHHGSKNGSPTHQIDKVFPAQSHDGKRRASVVSTTVGAYPGVPDETSLTMLRTRSDEFHDTRDFELGGWREVTFEG